MKKKNILIALLCMILALSWAAPAYALDAAYTVGPEIYGEAYCVMNADTGEILCGRNAMGKYYPASITKIMTALVIAEEIENLRDPLTFSKEAIDQTGSNSSTLQPMAMIGETMSVWDCMCGMMLMSGNECANALAEYCAGSTEAFAEKMNARAEQIGVTNTHFVNAHGLHNKNHYTSPYDMCLIMREALKNEVFRALDTQKTYTIPETNLCAPRAISMGHQMVVGAIPYDGVFAGKTGRTPVAGRTLVTAAKHNDTTIITVVMKSDDDYHYIDTQILLDYAYDLLDGKEAWNWKECDETVKATASVNLREKATVHANVRGSLQTDQTVHRTAIWGDWSRVEVDGRNYYCQSSFLTGSDAGKASASATGASVLGFHNSFHSAAWLAGIFAAIRRFVVTGKQVM